MSFSLFIARCSHDNEIDKFGRICNCSTNGTHQSCCRYRQSWSSLSSWQREQYVSAVLTVSSDPTYQPLYRAIISKYRTSFGSLAQNTDPEASQFIPWHRYFLLEYEDLLRLVQKNITIPYWDWSTSPSSPYAAPVFHPTTGFGDASDPATGCVSAGPFRDGEFEVISPNGSLGCLMRKYGNYTFINRELLDKSLALSADMFHNFVQLFLTLNIRCFVGGAMCSTNTASDPLFPLHLARVDLFVQRWQERGEANSVVQRSNKADNLQHTLTESLSVSDFCSNDELPFGTCVKYAPLGPVGVVDEGEGPTVSTFQCAPVDTLWRATGWLSEQASLYLTRTCDNT